MRKVKFRLWDNENARMTQPMQPVWFEENHWEDTDFAECARKCDHVLMQFSGMTDRNGKEVYEGDIVRYFLRNAFGSLQEFTGVCEFSDYTFLFRGLKDHPSMNADGFEVVGNIYQNKEMLK